MKKLQLVILVASAVGAMNASASLYDITFTGLNITATGQLDVSGNIATSGYLDVTYNGVTIDYNSLAPVGVGVENNNGDVLSGQDNFFNPNSITQGGFLSVAGMIFYNGSSNPSHVLGMIELSDDSSLDLTPNLYGSGNPPAGYGYTVPNIDGTLSVALVPVPESTTMVAGALLLLPFGASVLRVLRKSRTA